MPPLSYYAVIFSSTLRPEHPGYEGMAERMLEQAAKMPGFLGVESRREGFAGITVSYWRQREDIERWQREASHLEAQKLGREKWYSAYSLRIAKVEEEKVFP